jgi:hypothetical protein
VCTYTVKQFTNLIEFSDETNNVMAIDPFTALKWSRSSSEDENSFKEKPKSKKKENSPTDVPLVDGDYDTGPEEDDYMITLNT